MYEHSWSPWVSKIKEIFENAHNSLVLLSQLHFLCMKEVDVAGIKWISFLVAGRACFGFRMSIMLVTHWYFGWFSCVYPKSETFQCPMLCLRGAAQEAEGEHGQESWPRLTPGFFFPIIIIIFIIKLFSSQPTGFTFSQFSSPSHCSCRLGLKLHTSKEKFRNS